MAKSRLVANRKLKKATILASKRTVEDAVRRASALANAWMAANPNDPRLDELQRVADHLSSVLEKTPQEMSADGMSSIEDYFDDAMSPEAANTIKREVNMIAKWHDQQRPAAAPRTPEQQGVGYVPDSAVEQGADASRKKADGAGFITDRDEKGEAKAPEKMEVPRLAKRQKKEAVPEEPAAAPAPAAAAPSPAPAAPTPSGDGGAVNPIDYIPTETLIKVIEDLPKEEDFAQNHGKQDALIELTNILKSRPILPPEQPDAQQQAAPAPASTAPAMGGGAASAEPAAPMPVAASRKRADLGDHAMGGDGSIGNVGGTSPSVNSDPIGVGGGTGPGGDSNPAPEKAKIDLGGLAIASFEDDKTADDYRLHDYKVVGDEGIVPSGQKPSMDEQEARMHPEEEFAMDSSMDKEAVAPPHSEDVVHALKDESGVDNPFAVAWSMHNKGDKMSAIKAAAEVLAKMANAAAGGGWTNDVGEKGNIVEDGGNLPEVAEAHAAKDEAPAKLNRPATTAPMKLAAEMTTGKALKQSESLGNDLKKMYLDAKSLTQVNDARAVREAVEAIFRAADMFDEATKALSKQQQQEESEAAAQEIKAKNKKSSFQGLALAASE